MKEKSFNDKIHLLGRITVICALVAFMGVPFGLAAANGIPVHVSEVLKNAVPLLLTFRESVRTCPLCLSSEAAPSTWPA